jgi:hypothetical protein
VSGWEQMLSADVLTLGMAADQARRAQPAGQIATFVRVHELTPADLAGNAVVPEAASELRLYATPDSLNDAIAQVRAVRALAGERRGTAFSMAELERRNWPDFGAALAALVDAGLDDVAELPVDAVADLRASLQTLQRAGADPQRVTVSHPVSDRKIDIISRVQQTLALHPVPRFAPLPRVAPVDRPTTGYDDVRMVALARLALGATSIEVDWGLYGPKLAQVALTFGADHLDAVPATDDAALGPRRATVEDLERQIRSAGFTPREVRSLRSRAARARGN